MPKGYRKIPRQPIRYADRARVDANGCWVWLGYISPEGYGQLWKGYAHRVIYQQEVGPIPQGLVLDHLCRNRACCNPAHLEPVTQAENVRRSDSLTNVNTAKTHCPRGHSLSDAYLISRCATGKKFRKCRTCSIERYHSPEWKAWRRLYLARKREEKYACL